MAAAALLAAGAAHAATLQGSPMTFEEVMAGHHRLSSARFSPDGSRVLLEIAGPAAPTHGAPLPVSSSESVVRDLRTGREVRIGHVGEGGYMPSFCEPWSPDGRGLVFLTSRGGNVRFAYADAATGRATVLDQPPSSYCASWLAGKLVYLTDPAGQPADTDSTLRRAEHQTGRWRRAWSERAAQVTVHSGNAAFPSPAPPEGGLALADPTTGRSEVAAQGGFHSITVAPDGHTLAVVRLGETDVKALYKRTARRGELEVLRLGSSGRLVHVLSLPGYDVDYSGLAWSSDGSRILVGARSLADGALCLVVVSLNGEPPRRVELPPGVLLGEGERAANMALRPFAWLGERPAFIGATREHLAGASDARRDYGESTGRAFRLFVETDSGVQSLTSFARQSVTGFASLPTGTALVAADGGLWAVAPGQAPRRVSAPDLEVVGLAVARPSRGRPPTWAVQQDRAAVTVRASDGAARRVTLDLASGKPLLDLPAADVEALSPRLDAALTRAAKGWATELRIRGQGARRLMTLNSDWASRPVGEVKAVDHKLGDRNLRSWVLLPPGYRAGPLPAIVWIYGGQLLTTGPPEDSLPGEGATPVYEGQLWASRGYAVIYPSTPVGRAESSDIAQGLADAAVGAIDAAAAAGWVDPNRVGIMGHSFGGFSTAAVLSKRSDRFRAGIAMSGVYDWLVDWGSRIPSDVLVDQDSYGFGVETEGYVEQGQIGLGVPPFADPQRYLRASPFYQVERISTPLLLTVGDLDLGATNQAQSERMYAALRRVGNPAVLVRYWGQGHVQEDPGAIEDQWARFSAWFDHYLGRPPAEARATH